MLTIEVVAELAEDIIKFAEEPDSFVLREWPCRHKKGEIFFDEISKFENENNSTVFSEAYEYAKTKIGVKREMAAISGAVKGDTSLIRTYLPLYDKSFKEFLLEMKRFKENNKEPLVIKIQQYD